MIRFPPIVGEMITAYAESVKQLRESISGIKAEIRGGTEWIQFTLQGVTYDLPVHPDWNGLCGVFGEAVDRKIAIKSLLYSSDTEVLYESGKN